MVWRRERCPTLVSKHGMTARLGVTRKILTKNIGDRGETVVGLCCRHMMDVRCAGEVRRLIGDMPS